MRPHVQTEIYVRLEMAEVVLTAAAIVGRGTELADDLAAVRDRVRQLMIRTRPPSLS
jgi:hypothetical protein